MGDIVVAIILSTGAILLFVGICAIELSAQIKELKETINKQKG